MVARVEAPDAGVHPYEGIDTALYTRTMDQPPAPSDHSTGSGKSAELPKFVDFSVEDPLLRFARADRSQIALVKASTAALEPARGTTRDAQPAAVRDAQPPATRDTHDVARGTDSTPSTDSLAQSRQRLEADIRSRVSDPVLADKMLHDMAAFEKRMAGVPDGAAHVDATYKELTKLLESRGGHLTDTNKGRVAADILHAAADPGSVNQGFTNDCVVATMESRMYARNPERAAAIVVEASMTGHVRTTLDGKEITLAPSTFWNHQTLAGVDPKLHPQMRTLGDQIFQTVAYNAELNQLNKDDPSRKLRMELVDPTPPTDTGERVFDYAKHPRENVTGMRLTEPSIDPETNEAVYNNLARTHESGFTLSFVNADTPAELRSTLLKAQAEGKLPLMTTTSIEQDPIKAQFGGDEGIKAGLVLGVNFHAITVTGFDPRTGEVHYRNPTDGSIDRTMTLDQLYTVLHPPLREDTIPTLVPQVTQLLKEQGPETVRKVMQFMSVSDRQKFIAEYDKATGTRLERVLR